MACAGWAGGEVHVSRPLAFSGGRSEGRPPARATHTYVRSSSCLSTQTTHTHTFFPPTPPTHTHHTPTQREKGKMDPHDPSLLPLLAQLSGIPPAYLTQGFQAGLLKRQGLFRQLIDHRRLPLEGWDDATIEGRKGKVPLHSCVGLWVFVCARQGPFLSSSIPPFFIHPPTLGVMHDLAMMDSNNFLGNVGTSSSFPPHPPTHLIFELLPPTLLPLDPNPTHPPNPPTHPPPLPPQRCRRTRSPHLLRLGPAPALGHGPRDGTLR